MIEFGTSSGRDRRWSLVPLVLVCAFNLIFKVTSPLGGVLSGIVCVLHVRAVERLSQLEVRVVVALFLSRLLGGLLVFHRVVGALVSTWQRRDVRGESTVKGCALFPLNVVGLAAVSPLRIDLLHHVCAMCWSWQGGN